MMLEQEKQEWEKRELENLRLGKQIREEQEERARDVKPGDTGTTQQCV